VEHKIEYFENNSSQWKLKSQNVKLEANAISCLTINGQAYSKRERKERLA